jgi:hypothetical protein
LCDPLRLSMFRNGIILRAVVILSIKTIKHK